MSQSVYWGVTRIRQLDGLRAGAILMVFSGHAFGIPMGWAGVDLFFILSGFLITSILLRERHKSVQSYLGSFYGRRARRILPPYVVCLLLAAMLFPLNWRGTWFWYAFFGANIAESLGRGAGFVLAPLWSLSVEEQFYICWPLVVYWVPVKQLRYLLWGVLLAAPLFRGFATPLFGTYDPIYLLTPFRMDLLAAGALMGWHAHADPAWVRRNSWKALAGMAVSFAVWGAFTALRPDFRIGANSVAFNVAGYSLVVAFFASLVLYCLSLQGNWVYRVLTARPLTYIGRISYTMYLVHLMALTMFDGYGVWVRAGAALVVMIAFAAVSWELMEKRLTQHSKPALILQPGPVAADRFS